MEGLIHVLTQVVILILLLFALLTLIMVITGLTIGIVRWFRDEREGAKIRECNHLHDHLRVVRKDPR